MSALWFWALPKSAQELQISIDTPELMRRFINYSKDLSDIKYMYEEMGFRPPRHLIKEIKRSNKRFRYLMAL